VHVYTQEITTILTETVINVAGHPRWGHFITEVALSSVGGSASTLNTTNLEVDGIIKTSLKITSIPTITGGVSQFPFIDTIDIHYQSTGRGTKQKAPPFWN